ncbi:MAG: tyrosine-type recombinase/integrase [bacterium]|nr:tyrosine-type recombinase/integrase [bacterium]
MKLDLDLGVRNGDRRGPLLLKLSYEYVQWLLTYRSQEHALRTDLALSTILQRLPIKHVYKLKPDHIREYINRRRKDFNQKCSGKPISERTIHIEVGSLRSMLNCAVKQQWIPHNPLAGVELMPKPTYGMVDYLSADEIAKFFQHVEPAFRLMSNFFLVTGARLREAALLEWKEIDFNRKVVRFVRTKSKRAREVPLGNDMMAWLTERRAKAGYVFGTAKGNPRVNNVNRAMIAASKRACLIRHVHPHLLRHTFGTYLAFAGVSPYRLQALLGHSDLKTTMNYVHVAQTGRPDDSIRRIAVWLSEQVGEAEPSSPQRPGDTTLPVPDVETDASPPPSLTASKEGSRGSTD